MPNAQAEVSYTIRALGLLDDDHTGSDGSQWHSVEGLNAAGKAIGGSDYYIGSDSVGQSAWLFDGATTRNIGLTGAQYTSTEGYRWSKAEHLNNAGQAVGFTARYDGSTDLGQAAWLYNGATSVEIGLTGAEFTGSNGYRSNLARQLNDAGQARGDARWTNSAGDWLGQAAWVFNGNTTVEIGLGGGEHTRQDGFRFSDSTAMNNAGQVVGISDRFNNGTEFVGRSIWLYNGSTTLNIGLTGSEHTDANGIKFSFDARLNQAGQVIGHSYRYNGNNQMGQSAWLYNGATTVELGLTGAGYSRADGFKQSNVTLLNQAGHAAGFSVRYAGSEYQGQSAWLFNGTTTVQAGFTAAEFTASNGYKTSTVIGINELGQAIGTSDRFVGVNNVGVSAWFYNGATTIEIGLLDGAHAGAGGRRASMPALINAAGQVVGTSDRYAGEQYLGQSTWLYNGTSTLNIGLTGADYVGTDGYLSSHVVHMNEAGQVLGTSQRFRDGASVGMDGWVYDPILGSTVALQLSVSDDGNAFSGARYLSENGAVYGAYMLFEGNAELGFRVFSWDRENGMQDLGSLVEGGLTANGWDSLFDPALTNAAGAYAGHGLRLGAAGEAPFLLTPVSVPEPSTLVLAALGLGCLLYRARRTRAV